MSHRSEAARRGPGQRSHLGRLLAPGLLVAGVLAAAVSMTGSALAARGNGLNGVLSTPLSTGTGYGNGWVALSYVPNEPIIGYLFASDNQANGDRDYMDIYNSSSCGGPCTYPRGFAGGQFWGCAYAYSFDSFYQVGGHSVADCTPPNLSQPALFCSSGGDALCTPDGAWTTSRYAAVVAPAGVYCYAVANLTSAGFTGSASSHGTPKNLLAWVGYNGAEGVAVRYVTKDDQYVMVKFPAGRFAAYPDLRWAFVPRACVQG